MLLWWTTPTPLNGKFMSEMIESHGNRLATESRWFTQYGDQPKRESGTMGCGVVAAENRAAHLEKSVRNLPGSICLVRYLRCVDLDGDSVSNNYQ